MKFEKPGRRDDFDYPQMAEESVGKALQDAKVNYKDIEQAFVGYVFGKWQKNPLHLCIVHTCTYIDIHTYRTHTNSAPGYYFLARLLGGSSNQIFSNTRPLRPTFY